MAERNTSGGVVDYRLVCRTCLASDAEFYKLDAPIIAGEDEEKVNFMECLRYCTRLEDVPQFPIYICTECGAALQVAYNFIRNALEAHEILRQKLCRASQQQQQQQQSQHHQQRNNGVVHDSDNSGSEEKCSTELKPMVERKMRFRCKICNEKVETKKFLKEHVKLHFDVISYCCQLCSFESKKRSFLSDHYTIMHGVQPTREQLKPKTCLTAANANNNETAILDEQLEKSDEIYQQMEQIHNPKIPEFQQTVQLEQDQQQLEVVVEVNKQAAAATTANFNAVNTELQLDFDNNEFNVAANELSVGNEFIVMADGTVEEVMGNGVVIEYINAADDGVTLENGLVLNNLVQVSASDEADIVNAMDVDDIIIEESEMLAGSTVATTPGINTDETVHAPASPDLPAYTSTLTNIEDELPPPAIITSTGLTAKRVKCKICASNFSTQDQLKTHMLTHNEIPHFFCDQCTFYTFFKIDLTQHYKTKHKLQPTFKQLQPKNKVKPNEQHGDLKHVYTCDMCLYETYIKAQLRRHYLSKHHVEATEVQLRPTIDETDILTQPVQTSPSKARRNKSVQQPDYPNGMNCKKCFKTFYWRNKLKEHYKQHSLEEAAPIKTNAQVEMTVTNVLNQDSLEYTVETVQNNYAHNAAALDTNSTLTSAPVVSSAEDLILDIPVAATVTATSVPSEHNTALGYSCAQIPSDAIPQIVETDTTIDNDIDFVFNDALFEDFGDDENENEEDNEEQQDLLLTSEDDFEDLIEEQQQRQGATDEASADIGVSTPPPYCAHCNKSFFSQYQFENHMFVHRGLAPYRCEMCTNLYNTKRALIRHYKAVHKKVPTRDMIQAKGDKVTVDRIPVEHLHLEEQKAVTLMCAKCPYESTEMNHLQIHLNTIHSITNENYILQKLPYECPRCIRSYATKMRLIRHLERSHSVATIIQQHRSATPASRSAIDIQVNTNIAANTVQEQSSSSTNERCGINIVEHNQSNKSNATATTSAAISTANAKRKYNKAHVDVQDAHADMELQATSTARNSKNKYFIMKEEATGTDYKCVTCEFIGTTSDALRMHRRQAHPAIVANENMERANFSFECSICQCKYKSIDLLKYHMKRHIARKYRCNKCPKSYINRSELKNHQRLHTGEMPHQCDLCVKKFRYPHHLKRHRDVAHLGKRYRCSVEGCERIFTTQAQLKIHAWNHNGNIPYKCKYCDRSFKKRESLRQHARKVHQCLLTEEEIAEIYRQNVGYTNPHDFTVSVSNGKMLRRTDVEASESLREVVTRKEDKAEQTLAEMQIQADIKEEECVLEIDTNAEQSLPTYILNDMDNADLAHF